MSEFRVWAPSARTVRVSAGGVSLAMKRGDGGWWWKDAPKAGPGTDYSFVLDGGDPVPDPRSPWQPRGVHRASRVVDHAAFRWTDAGWRPRPLSSAVVYEMHIGTFTQAGTFDAAIARLNHVVQLGVTHLEIMPVAEFPGGRGWGYDGVCLFAPHHIYGGPESLKRFVDACHTAGLAVLLDVVYNHLGPDGNYLSRFGPYFTAKYSTPWGEAVNFDDRGSDEVRRFFCDNARMWLRDYHFDGLRLDAIQTIYDFSAVHFLEQLSAEVKELEAQVGRQLVLVAESDLNDPKIVRSAHSGGYGLDAQCNDDFHHVLHVALTGAREGYYADFGALADLGKSLQNGFIFDGRYSPLRGRRHGRPAPGVGGHRFIGFSQNHDQVGNSAGGARIFQIVGAGRAKIAAALVLTAPFIPMLFQGEEFGASSPFQYFTDHENAVLAEAVREGRRRDCLGMGWSERDVADPGDAETFECSKLDWNEIADEPHSSLLGWYRRLIALRRDTPCLADGRLDRVRTRFGEHPPWIAMERGTIAVLCNLAAVEQTIPDSPNGELLLASEPNCPTTSKGCWRLPPHSVAIVRSDSFTYAKG